MDDETLRRLELSGYPLRRAVGRKELQGELFWVIDSKIVLSFSGDDWQVRLYPERKTIPGDYWFDYIDACRMHSLGEPGAEMTERGVKSSSGLESFVRWFSLFNYPIPSPDRRAFDDAMLVTDTMHFRTCVARNSAMPIGIDTSVWRVGLRCPYGPLLADDRTFLRPMKSGVKSWVVQDMGKYLSDGEKQKVIDHPKMGFDGESVFSLTDSHHRVNEIVGAVSRVLSITHHDLWSFLDPPVSEVVEKNRWKRRWIPENHLISPRFKNGVFR